MTKRCMKLAVCVAMLACLFTLGAPPASADTFNFDLALGDPSISGFPGPYVGVTVFTPTLNSSIATIVFTSLVNSGNIYLMGDASTVAVNVNAINWTISNITGSNSGTGFSAGSFSDGGPGFLNQTVNNFGGLGGFNSSSDLIFFTLTNNSGTWADAASVLTPNASGSLAAAHIFVTSVPANASNVPLADGFATNSPTTPSVPEPSSLSMLGIGVLGLLGFARRRFLA